MTSKPEADPGGVQAGIDRYRDLAKYLITIFAGVGALLVAGTQLADIGTLSFDDAPDRALAAIIGLAVAIAAIVLVVAKAAEVLQPIQLTLADVVGDAELAKEANARSDASRGGLPSVADLKDLVDGPLVTDEFAAIAREVVDRAMFTRARKRFEAAWKWMLVGALAGTAGIVAFAWGVNPPKSATADPVVRPDPVELTFTLTAEGRETLADALGEQCVAGEIRALSIGGTEAKPRVVVLPENGCDPAQFVLQPEFGAPIASEQTP